MSDTQREAQKVKADAKLDEWRARLEQIEAKARGASADVRSELDRAGDDLREKIQQLRSAMKDESSDLDAEIDRLSASAEGAWEAIKERFRGDD